MLLIEVIIEKVKIYPYIYDKNNDDYKNKEKVNEAFDFITTEINDQYDDDDDGDMSLTC